MGIFGVNMEISVIESAINGLFEYANNLPADYVNGAVGNTKFTRDQLRAQIVALNDMAFAEEKNGGMVTGSDLDDVFPLRHMFAPGVYGREITIPEGHWIIGKIHKHAHFSVISKGKVAVLTEDGPVVMSAPYTFVSSPLAKRVVLALEDTIWTTFHITNETDLALIENQVIAKTYDDVLEITQDKGEIL